MSIPLAEAQFYLPAAAVVGLIVWTGVAVVLLTLVLRRGGIAGPVRLRGDEPAMPLLMIFIAALVTWLLVPLMYAVAKARATGGAAQALSGQDLLWMTLLAGSGATLVLLVGNLGYRPGGLGRLGLDVRLLPRGLWQGALGILIVMPLMTWVGVGTEQLWKALHYQHAPAHEMLQLLRQVRHDPRRLTALLAMIVVITPLFEELLFRAHLQTLLGRLLGRKGADHPEPGRQASRWRPWLVVGIASLLFSAVHPLWMMPPIFFLSVCLGYAYERTGNLWTPIVIHALFNGLSTLFYTLLPH